MSEPSEARIVDDEGLENLRYGYDPVPRVDHREQAVLYDMVLAMGAPPGLAQDVGRWYERFERDPHFRLIMQLADEKDIPFSEASHRWRDPEDLAAALAWSARQARDRMERCPNCHVRPDEMYEFDDDGNAIGKLDEPLWKFYKHDCGTCDELYEHKQDLTPEERERGVMWTMMPRKPGEPQVDGF